MMAFRFFIFGLMLLYFPFLAHGQNENTLDTTTNRYIFYRLGISYPFITEFDATKYHVQEDITVDYSRSLNGGGLAGIGAGYRFFHAISIDMGLYAFYSDFSQIRYHVQRLAKDDQSVIYTRNGVLSSNHLGALYSLNMNVDINRSLKVTFGIFQVSPFFGKLYKEEVEIEYQFVFNNGDHFPFHPPHLDSYKFDSRLTGWEPFNRNGLHGQVSILLKANGLKQNRINIEYYHTLSEPFLNQNGIEKWFAISYTKIFFR
jgi:hypothetical protein